MVNTYLRSFLVIVCLIFYGFASLPTFGNPAVKRPAALKSLQSTSPMPTEQGDGVAPTKPSSLNTPAFHHQSYNPRMQQGSVPNAAYQSLSVRKPRSSESMRGMRSTVYAHPIAIGFYACFKSAENHDKQFLADRYAYLAVQLDVKIARAQFLPKIGLASEINARGVDQNTAISAQYHFGPIGPIPKTSLFTIPGNNSLSKIATVGIRFDQTLFDMSDIREYSIAKSLASAARESYLSQRDGLMTKTVSNYLNIIAAENNIRLMRSKKKILHRLFRNVKIAYKNNEKSRFSLIEAKFNLLRASADERSLYQQKKNALLLLTQSTGPLVDKLKSLNAVRIPTIGSMLPFLRHSIPSYEYNHSWRRLYFASIASKKTISAASGKRYPRLSLEAAGGVSFTRQTTTWSSKLFNTFPYHVTNNIGDTLGYEVGIQLTMPLYTGGLISAEGSRAVYKYEQAVAQLDNLSTILSSNTKSSTQTIAMLRRRIKADRERVLLARKLLRMTKTKNVLREGSMLDFLNILDGYVSASRELESDFIDLINQQLSVAKNKGELSDALLQKMDKIYLK